MAEHQPRSNQHGGQRSCESRSQRTPARDGALDVAIDHRLIPAPRATNEDEVAAQAIVSCVPLGHHRGFRLLIRPRRSLAMLLYVSENSLQLRLLVDVGVKPVGERDDDRQRDGDERPEESGA